MKQNRKLIQRYMHTVNGTNPNYDKDDPITIQIKL